MGLGGIWAVGNGWAGIYLDLVGLDLVNNITKGPFGMYVNKDQNCNF